MKKHAVKRVWRQCVARAAGGFALALVAACGSAGAAGSGATSTVATSSLAASSTTDANAAVSPNSTFDENQTLGVEHILPMLHLMPHEAAMGLHCDPNATKTHLMVCAEEVPGSAQATWSSCQARPPQFGHGAGLGRGMMPPWGGMGAGMGDANMMGGSGAMGANMVADANMTGGGHHHRLSSGSLTITASATPSGNATCDANTSVTVTRQAQFIVTVTDANGPTLTVSGTNSESMSQGATHDGNITLDVNRTLVDAGGNVLASTVVTGTVQFSADPNATAADANALAKADPNAPDAHGFGPGGMQHRGPHGPDMHGRLISGSVTVNGDAVVLDSLTHSAGCMWPTAGSIQRTDGAGTSHTLVFGTPCGSATLDGQAITLPAHPPHGSGHPQH